MGRVVNRVAFFFFSFKCPRLNVDSGDVIDINLHQQIKEIMKK